MLDNRYLIQRQHIQTGNWVDFLTYTNPEVAKNHLELSRTSVYTKVRLVLIEKSVLISDADDFELI